MDVTEKQVLDLLQHRERVLIFQDPEDGVILVNVYNVDMDERIIPGSLVVDYGSTLWGALGGAQGSIMEQS